MSQPVPPPSADGPDQDRHPADGPPSPAVLPFVPAAAPPQGSKALPIALASVAVVLTLCVGGTVAVGAFLAGRSGESGTADAKSAPATTPASTPARTVDIVLPATLGGRPKLIDPFLAGPVKGMEADLRQAAGATTSVSGLYATGTNVQQVVMMIAVKATVRDPATAVSQALGLLMTKEVGSVAAGPLGGVTLCGRPSAAASTCGWADNDSVGVIMWNGQPVSTATAEFSKLRAEIEHRA